MKRRPMEIFGVRKGMLLVDEFGQVCRIESITRCSGEVVGVTTRRRDGGKFWGEVASWTSSQFNARGFTRHRKREAGSPS